MERHIHDEDTIASQNLRIWYEDDCDIGYKRPPDTDIEQNFGSMRQQTLQFCFSDVNRIIPAASPRPAFPYI